MRIFAEFLSTRDAFLGTILDGSFGGGSSHPINVTKLMKRRGQMSVLINGLPRKDKTKDLDSKEDWTMMILWIK